MCILLGFVIIQGNAEPWIEGQNPSFDDMENSESDGVHTLSSLQVCCLSAVNYFPGLTGSSCPENVRCLLILFPTPF